MNHAGESRSPRLSSPRAKPAQGVPAPYNAGIWHDADPLMAPDFHPMPPAQHLASLGLPADLLQRARVHAELAGLDPRRAARIVSLASERTGLGPQPVLRFWRALMVQLMPLLTRFVPDGDLIAGALGGLSIESRSAVLLRLGEGFDVPTIARVLGENEERTRQHLALALRSLRQRLEQERPGWLTALPAWLEQRQAQLVDIEPEPEPVAAPRLPSSAPHRRRWLLWLGLAALLVAAWLLWRWQGGGTGAETAGIDPMEPMLTLSEEDFALIGDRGELATIEDLDFLLWQAQRDAH